MTAIDPSAPHEAMTAGPGRLARLRRKSRPTIRQRSVRNASQSFTVTFIAVVVLAAFLSPLVRSFSLSIKSPEQVAQVDGPLYPASPASFTFEGRDYDVYVVPLPDGTTRNLALIKKGRTSSTFVDPANEALGRITWEGQWRTLTPAWTFDPQWHNYTDVWEQIDYPRLLFNTVAIALIGMIGTLVSCTLVAYGFARFRFPGRDLLFILVIATIFLPGAVTIIPTYALFAKIGWVGTWLPLLVPTFFANAYDVFLLRQYFRTIPREMDEAAAIDGAGPFRTLVSVLIPQSWPVIVAVGIFHLVYSWNDFFAPLIYLSTNPELVTLPVGLASFSGARIAENPGLIQAGTLMTMIIPVILFLIFQRFFVRGIVITGVEK
ncbi:MAG: multiple sugar transport system permease protein [Chloroflexota bacterium]|jgi:multiple sugar transport system permease protein|nr:multiple sugar transport system permease protein [Chloroflexota bacterium]